ncbi:MAG: 3-hydroxyacyl-CoA dehydrogenase NAD-binding domain-containing protein [Acidocella sp.]|nr:3-hydroxyacyl-CoA dehydrogenase NAD-binding domain-containing protein [Acidocella sp.]
MTARYTQDKDIAILTVYNPPVNALSAAMRRDLFNGIARAIADPDIIGIVIIGDPVFIAGADIREFGKPATFPGLRDLYPPMEGSPKPIFAAISGAALGGGYELCLACHYRVALASGRVGLPEVNIGLLPGGGGTTRLPRLIGAQPALDLMLSGKHISATQALALGMVDKVFSEDLLGAATMFARERANAGGTHPVLRDRIDKIAGTDPDLFSNLRKQNAAKWRGLTAPGKILDCVEATSTMPFDQAYAFEAEAFDDCLASPARKALIHVFFAERQAAKIEGVGPDIKPRKISKAGVIGAGTMGGGIAMALANAGLTVIQTDVSDEALERGRNIIEANYATSVSRGSMTKQAMEVALGLISSDTDYAALADCDIVIEAAFEDMDVKQTIFRKLDDVLKPGAVFATNTSTLDIDKIATAITRPQDFVGTHFFSPANVMRLQENVRGAATSLETLATVTALAKKIGKMPVLAGNCDGFIGNRILAAYGREADFLLEEGATPWQIDDALMAFGFPMGIYRMRDMSGLDVGWRIRKYREQFRDKSTRYSPIADKICELGRFGQKTKAGYYRYDGRTPIPDPEIETLINQTAADLGIERVAVADDEIVTRILTAMVNEGAKIVDEGFAQRASDVDIVFIYGYGFPRYQGGPMFWAEQRGLKTVCADVERYFAAYGKLWEPAPLLVRLASSGATSWS